MKQLAQNLSSLTETVLAEFGLEFKLGRVVALNLPLSRSAQATIFFNNKNQLFVYISTPARQTLGDVKKLLYRIGVVAYKFCPPVGQPNYFTDIASEHFYKTFPGRKIVSDNDLRYFKTLALYNPALVQIKSVKSGVINCFDPDAKGEWRPFVKLQYNRLGDF